jgi:DNA-binding MarR family transcriptional regulator
MDLEARRELRALEVLAENEGITQRGLASKLGIALGLTNLYIKRLARKGFIKLVNVQSNRILYLVTPQGIREKSRLTYEYIEYSLYVYREVRQHLREVLQPLVTGGPKAIAIYGTGEAAELAYLSIKEVGLEPAAIFDGDDRTGFLGMAVHPIADHHRFQFDYLIVANLDNLARLAAQLIEAGVPSAKLIPLRPGVVPQQDGNGAAARDERSGALALPAGAEPTPRRGGPERSVVDARR